MILVFSISVSRLYILHIKSCFPTHRHPAKPARCTPERLFCPPHISPNRNNLHAALQSQELSRCNSPKRPLLAYKFFPLLPSSCRRSSFVYTPLVWGAVVSVMHNLQETQCVLSPVPAYAQVKHAPPSPVTPRPVIITRCKQTNASVRHGFKLNPAFPFQIYDGRTGEHVHIYVLLQSQCLETSHLAYPIDPASQ